MTTYSGEGNKTIRQIVQGFQNEIQDGDLLPERAAEILTILSALLGNIADEIRKRDLEYNIKLLECYQAEAKANRAKILAETSPEYTAMRLARDVEKQVIQMTQSLKYYLKTKEREYQYTGR